MKAEWINTNKRLPPKGAYLVRFLIEVLGVETPFEDKKLYAEGHFNPQAGWIVENGIIYDYMSAKGFSGNKLRVTHWLEVENYDVDEMDTNK